MLNALTKDAILKALCTEETQCQAAQEEAEATATTKAITCHFCEGSHRVLDCPSLSSAHTFIKKEEATPNPHLKVKK
ncbi:hypothetical protein H2248_011945 [Termitomyces sp. 'cryptogamus']|nr:hypothetical protein H2248_011945 [Termitomyces sp. 'cryptogamus']